MANVATITFNVTLQREASYLALAVSRRGFMDDPHPSRAVMGLREGGVHLKSLTAKIASSVMAPLSPAEMASFPQVLSSSFEVVNGISRLLFTIERRWLEWSVSEACGANGSVTTPPSLHPYGVSTYFIWSHSATGFGAPAHHLTNRGMVQLDVDSTAWALLPAASRDSPCSARNSLEVGLCFADDGLQLGPTAFIDEGNAPPGFRTDFDHSQQLDNDYRLRWKAIGRWPNGHVNFELQARTTGWVALGLKSKDFDSALHGMVHTDMWLGCVRDGKATLVDAFSTSISPPVVDRQADVFDVSGFERDGITVLYFSRAYVTNDTFDHRIEIGQHLMTFSYSRRGSDDMQSYHGPARGYLYVSLVHPEDTTLMAALAVPLGMLLVAALVSCLLIQRQRARARRQLRLRLRRDGALPQLTLPKDTIFHLFLSVRHKA